LECGAQRRFSLIAYLTLFVDGGRESLAVSCKKAPDVLRARKYQAARCAVLQIPSHSKTALRLYFKVIVNIEMIYLERSERLLKSGGRGAFEPGGGTPTISGGDVHQSMMHRVSMHVVQAGKIGWLKRQMSVPKIIPNLPAWCAIQIIHPLGRGRMEFTEKSS
jgi:hypothetical protein